MALNGFDHKVTWAEFMHVTERPGAEDENAQISSNSSNSNLQIKHQGNIVSILKLDIQLFVVTAGSWVVSGTETDALLIHEQGHFDLLAIGMRTFYNALLALKGSSTVDLQTKMNDLLRTTQKKITEINDRYDSESQTNHGRNTSIQQQWDSRIAATKLNPLGLLSDLP